MPELMIPPLVDCLASEIAMFLLWIYKGISPVLVHLQCTKHADIPPLDDCLASEIATFILWDLIVSHWQQRVFDVRSMLTPPLDDCLSGEIPTFLLGIFTLSHWC